MRETQNFMADFMQQIAYQFGTLLRGQGRAGQGRAGQGVSSLIKQIVSVFSYQIVLLA